MKEPEKRHRPHIKRLIIIMTVLVLAGCGRTTDDQKAEDSKTQQKPKSNTQTMINGLTGRTAVRAGQRARTIIESTSAKKDQDLEEIYGK